MPEFAPVLYLSVLSNTTGFRLDGAAGSFSGLSVSTAGDVNGDGFDDVIVGAPLANPNGSKSGAAYVVFGKPSVFPSEIDLSSLNGNNGFRLAGVAMDHYSGISVDSAGDVNGDGFDDVIVGTHRADPNGGNSGSSFVVFGKAAGFGSSINLSTLNGTTGFRLDGAAANNLSGISVSLAGDVNGDGFADLIVGAVGASPNGQSSAGSSYVVFGKTAGFSSTINLGTLNGASGFRLDGVAANDDSGRSVSAAGDVNGDGFDDVIVGADTAQPNGQFSGSSYVVFGKALGFSSAINLSALDGSNGFRLDGVDASDFSGRSVSSAGDVNGDGFADLLIGADGVALNGQTAIGSAYVVLGRSFFAEVVPLSALGGVNGFRLDGVRAFDRTGMSVSNAGDVNGDGYGDLIIGAEEFDPAGRLDAGAAYVIFGKASGFSPVVDLGSLDGDDGFVVLGVAAEDYAGGSVSAAGDVNGDGFDDLIVGAYGADPSGAKSGSSYVVFGHRAETAVKRVGTNFDNRINGGFGDDTISGLSGNDSLNGWEGDDSMGGGGGNDTFDGGADSDLISGGSGLDTIFASLGDDTIVGGSQSDVIDFLNIAGGGVTANLANGTVVLPDVESSLVISQVERLSGSTSADHFVGNVQANTLTGRSGDDTLSAGAGSDRLVGQLGADQLTGSLGADTFDFNVITETPVGAGRDTIIDFASVDLVDLSTIDARTNIIGDQAFNFIGTNTLTGISGQLRFALNGGNSVVAGDVDGDGAGDFQILLLGVTTLAAADFIL